MAKLKEHEIPCLRKSSIRCTPVFNTPMIQSKFIHQIISLLIETDQYEELLRSQITLLEELSYEYTGSGAIISFAILPAINDYRLPVLTRILNGVRIESPKLNIGADANLFVAEGIIHYLEIFSLDGNYPEGELQTYRLTQIWEGSPQKEITSGSP